jgi:UDP-N-acetylglucosamine transferase subunit ALG13
VIFVTVGTNEARFERLLRAVAGLTTAERFVIQHGHSPPIGRPKSELVDFLPFEAMVETMRSARVVVTHAGVGSVMVALSNGKRPVVVPRRKSLGEAVDDHQLQLGRRFAQAGLVTLVETEHALGDALEQQQAPPALPTAGTALARDLRRFLEGVVAPSPARP